LAFTASVSSLEWDFRICQVYTENELVCHEVESCSVIQQWSHTFVIGWIGAY